MAFVVNCYDLLIKNGIVFDPGQSIHKKMHIGIYGHNICDLIDPENGSAKICAHRVVDAEGLYVIPGILDSHVHILPSMPFNYDYNEMWKLGITGCMDVLASQTHFHKFIPFIDNVPCTMKVAMDISSIGGRGVPRFANLETEAKKERMKRTFDTYPELFRGVKSFIGAGDTPTPELTIAVLEKTREVCDYIGCRMIMHVANAPVKLPDYIKYFKPGDIFAHTYNKGNILDENGKVYPEAFEAKERGVIFDSCRGSRNWSYEVGKAAFAQGFYPDVISSDLTALANDPNTSRIDVHMGECMAAGMSFEDVVNRVTYAAANVMGQDVKTGIKRGNPANITVLKLEEGPHTFIDAFGVKSVGDKNIVVKATIARGQVMYDKTDSVY